MTQKTNTLHFYNNNLNTIKKFALLPLSILKDLFFPPANESDNYINFRPLFVLVGLFMLTPLLVAFTITASLGAVAALAVTIFFPFNYLFSAAGDWFSPASLKDEETSDLSGVSSSASATDLLGDVAAPAPAVRRRGDAGAGIAGSSSAPGYHSMFPNGTTDSSGLELKEEDVPRPR